MSSSHLSIGWRASFISRVLLSLIFFCSRCNGTVDSDSNKECRCFPGDDCWPSDLTWQALNVSIHGKLVATVPLAAPCHDPTYNLDVCKSLQKNWFEPPQQ